MSQAKKDPLTRRKNPKRTAEGAETSVVPIRDADLLGSTLPPTPLRDLLAAEGASVYVLSDDASLLATVREAGGEQFPVFPAGSWQALREVVADNRCGIALLDIDSISGKLTDRLVELARLSPALVTLIASSRETADGLLNLLADRKIYRLLIKPPTVGITRLLLESSVSRHIELRQQPGPEPTAGGDTGSGFPGWPSWLLAGGLVVGVLATVVLTSLINRQDPPPVTVTTPVPESSIAEVPVEESVPLVVTPDGPAAQLAVGAAGTAQPAQDDSINDAAVAEVADVADAQPDAVAGELGAEEATAVAMSQPAEQQAPAAPEAIDLEAMYASVEAALIAEDIDAAATLLAELEVLDPGASRLAFLSAQIGRERVRITVAEQAAAAEAAELAAAAAPDELASLVGLARARLDQAQLTAPAGDSALDYYARARAANAEASETQLLATDLGAAVLTAAEVALVEGRFAAAQELFLEAQRLNVNDEDLVGLELSLVYARESLARAEQDSLLAEARERLAEGLLFEPATDNALATLLEVQSQNPDHPELAALFGEVGQALQAAAEGALAVADWERAAAAIDAVLRTGAPLSVLEPLRARLQYGQTQEAYLAEAGPASELSIMQFAPPIYPASARRRGVEGWVDLEFIVDRQGLPYAIVVAGAEPADEFEAAALDAAETYVYEPFALDGEVYERRIGLRIRFAFE